jgi:hypothetical protein
MLKQNPRGMTVKIAHQPVDICPLCEEMIDGRNRKQNTKVVANGRLLFYAHKKCVSELNDFIRMMQEVL